MLSVHETDGMQSDENFAQITQLKRIGWIRRIATKTEMVQTANNANIVKLTAIN